MGAYARKSQNGDQHYYSRSHVTRGFIVGRVHQRRELGKGQERISKPNTSLRSATVGRLFIVLVYNLTDKRISGVEMHGLMRTRLRNNSDQTS